MNYICTWLCADEKGEENIGLKTRQRLCGPNHQHAYWRCLLVFYVTSKRFNTTEKHLLFTNVGTLPVVDGKKVSDTLHALNVQVILTDFKYKTPKGYFGLFQNQFYEFSILEYIVENNSRISDNYLILDTDCIFIKPVRNLFNAAAPESSVSFEDNCSPNLVAHGLSRKNVQVLYDELFHKKPHEISYYRLGEFLLCSVESIQKVFNDFRELWPQILDRHHLGLMRFNEEANTLSYLYYKNGFKANPSHAFMKRIWTNPLFYRNVQPSDLNLVIWHLPAEKTYGIARLYDLFILRSDNYGTEINNGKYLAIVQKTLGIPSLSIKMKVQYYVRSYYRALKKKLPKFSAILKGN